MLAEGHSNRFWPFNADHKSLYSVAGTPLIVQTIEALSNSNLIKDVFVVYKKGSKIPVILPDMVGDMKVVCIEGVDNPKGTGDSLYRAKEYIDGDFALIWPDMVNADVFVKDMIEVATKNGVSSAMIGAKTNTPWNFGMVKMEDGLVKDVIEKPKEWNEKQSIKRIGVELFGRDIFDIYESLEDHHETDLVDALNIYVDKNNMILVEQEHYVPVLKYPWDLLTIMNVLLYYFRTHKKNGFLNKGKNPVFSENSVIKGGCKIGGDVSCRGNVYIGENVVISEGVSIVGPVIIEENSVIESGCKISRSIIGVNSHISKDSVIEDSIISHNNKIGEKCNIKGTKGDKSVISVVNENKEVVPTGRINLGLIMGENSIIGDKCSIDPGVILLPDTKIKDSSRLSFDYYLK